MPHVVDDVFAGEQVLGRFVLEDAAVGFFNGQLGQIAVLVQGGNRALGDDIVDLFLIIIGIVVQSLQSQGDLFVDLRDMRNAFLFRRGCGSRCCCRYCLGCFLLYCHTSSS